MGEFFVLSHSLFSRQIHLWIQTGAHCARRMGRREADSSGAMTTRHHSELSCLQDAASSGHRTGEESPRLVIQSPCKQQRKPDTDATTGTEVKTHQHKHNLKHRYEVMETLGKGTYGKVKKAVERASLKTVSVGKHDAKRDLKLSRATVCARELLFWVPTYVAEGNTQIVVHNPVCQELAFVRVHVCGCACVDVCGCVCARA